MPTNNSVLAHSIKLLKDCYWEIGNQPYQDLEINKNADKMLNTLEEFFSVLTGMDDLQEVRSWIGNPIDLIPDHILEEIKKENN